MVVGCLKKKSQVSIGIGQFYTFIVSTYFVQSTVVFYSHTGVLTVGYFLYTERNEEVKSSFKMQCKKNSFPYFMYYSRVSHCQLSKSSTVPQKKKTTIKVWQILNYFQFFFTAKSLSLKYFNK